MDDLRPSEVREKLLEDHRQLRAELERIRALASEPELSEQDVLDLRDMGEAFLEVLAAHMRWEDENLAPALRAADAWGPERESRLAREHRQQRESLRELIARLHVRPGAEIARDLLAFADWLERDMLGEEAIDLDPDVLRDDVVAVDAVSG